MRNGDDVWIRLLQDGRRLGPSPDFEGMNDGDLEYEVRTQAVVLTMATCRWLEHLAEFIVRDLWVVAGVRTPADWLSWALGVAPSTAREQVRVALRLRECPLVLERFRAGTLSYSKVRAAPGCACRPSRNCCWSSPMRPPPETSNGSWPDCGGSASPNRIPNGPGGR